MTGVWGGERHDQSSRVPVFWYGVVLSFPPFPTLPPSLVCLLSSLRSQVLDFQHRRDNGKQDRPGSSIFLNKGPLSFISYDPAQD